MELQAVRPVLQNALRKVYFVLLKGREGKRFPLLRGKIMRRGIAGDDLGGQKDDDLTWVISYVTLKHNTHNTRNTQEVTEMSSLTLSIPGQLRQKMKKFKYINWSEVARAAIIDKMKVLEKMDNLLMKSSLSENDTVKYGRMVKKRQWSKTKKMLDKSK